MKPADIRDMRKDELGKKLEELQKQSLHVSALDIQRRLTLLIKAETELAYASFPRLIVEMALLKATLLPPLVPIQELMEKIKTLETAAVHTPVLPWDTARTTPVPLPQHTEPRSTTTSPQSIPSPAAAPAAVTGASGGQGDWGRFVAFVNGKDRQLGSVLEHGSPLKY